MKVHTKSETFLKRCNTWQNWWKPERSSRNAIESSLNIEMKSIVNSESWQWVTEFAKLWSNGSRSEDRRWNIECVSISKMCTIYKLQPCNTQSKREPNIFWLVSWRKSIKLGSSSLWRLSFCRVSGWWLSLGERARIYTKWSATTCVICLIERRKRWCNFARSVQNRRSIRNFMCKWLSSQKKKSIAFWKSISIWLAWSIASSLLSITLGVKRMI